METNIERLEQAVATLNDLIALTQAADLRESTQFLAMAKLHLLMDLNGVSDQEFRALCDLLEGRKPPRRTRRGAPRIRRDSQLRGMHRAWLCPQDAPAGRGRGRARQNAK
jgi:hypothetical protein